MARRPERSIGEEPKRKALLADRFLAGYRLSKHNQLYHPKALEQINRAARTARRFVFDEQATERVAEVVTQIPELIVREHQFARAPFDVCWIEFPSWKMFEVLQRHGRTGRFQLETADHTVAYLIDHNRVTSIVSGSVGGPENTYITPIQYVLNTEWPLQDQLDLSEILQCSRMEFDAFMWGSTWRDIPKDQRYSLRANNALELIPLHGLSPMTMGSARVSWLQATARGMIGDLRNLIAMLLMLNRPSITRYIDVSASRGWHRNRNIPYMAHTSIQVSLDAVETLRLIGTPRGEAVERRRHEVRGHYCHDQTARDYSRIAGCIHDFRSADDEWTPNAEIPADQVHHWICAACGGKRWWRAAHERGTAEVGFVAHDEYAVTG